MTKNYAPTYPIGAVSPITAPEVQWPAPGKRNDMAMRQTRT
eukprot:CAMPEP_0203808450 /NCGR_PEP_ID=MMETSP0115-20131106/1634_1 /ASSEMBLY_ACC=CAM_ASM_000227 /TAXON_ID=33651 /ORGANISM="Bicosoecid sp, Strain ms1" /LENGTH=40 /DNA_ID= /DNA_START= /DNA_END= /DNA_ORIENTATION=